MYDDFKKHIAGNVKAVIEHSNDNSLKIKLEVDTEQLDVAIEKANQLNELLQSAKQIADSLFKN